MTDADNRLGEKIRELRLRRHMTQKELAGDRITRNMLSLIENGAASPSVSSLLYISEKLDIPAGYFISATSEDEARFFKLTLIDELKSLFKAKKYAECEELCQKLPAGADDDEISYILASSYIYTAIRNADGLNVHAALSDLDKAAQYTSRSIYCGDVFTKAITYIKESIRYAAYDSISELLTSCAYVSEFIPHQIPEYFMTLKYLSVSDKPPFTFQRGSCYEKHITALLMLKDDKVAAAQARLRELSLDTSMPYYMLYRILCDLEKAAEISGDMRLAYSSSRRKLELIERFRV